MSKISSLTREQVTKRADGCCEYCMSQQKYASSNFSIEHIQPISKGGSNNLENLALACQGCNNYKYTKTTAIDPLSKKEVNLFNPREDNWVDHFQWNENFTVIKGITSSGKATIIALHLNREFLINQRTIYRAYGVHPPKHSLPKSN